MLFFVYVHKRATDGKIFYVGKGCRYRHKSTWGRSNYWWNTVRCYGYTIEIIKKALSEDEAFALEKKLIKRYAKHGLCNLTTGGEGAAGVNISDATRRKLKQHRANPQYRKNISRKAKQRYLDAEFKAAHILRVKSQMANTITRTKISQSLRKYFSEPSTRQKLSQNTRKYFANSKNRAHARRKALERFDTPEKRAAHAQAKPILCVETGVIFGTGTLAAEWICSQGKYKGDHSSIAKVCRGVKPQAYGYTWRYVTTATGEAAKSSAD